MKQSIENDSKIEINKVLETQPTAYSLFKKASRKQRISTFIVILFFLIGIIATIVGDISKRKYCQSVGGEYNSELLKKSGCHVSAEVWREYGKEIQDWENSTSHFMNVYIGYDDQVFPSVAK